MVPDGLICETCGYRLDGLGVGDACSECGRRVATSLPEARRGTPWQRGASPGSLVGTVVGLLRSPTGVFDAMKPSASHGLLAVNLLVCSAIGFGGGLLYHVLSYHGLPETSVEAVRATLYSISFGLGCGAVFYILTAIEVLGVRIWSRRLGRRLEYRVIWGVCAHASFGWYVAAALVGLAWGVQPLTHSPLATSGTWWLTPLTSIALPIFAGGFVGMLVFETLVYVGVRRCRFINLPIGGGPVEPATTS